MTRRRFLSSAILATVPAVSHAPLIVPVHHILDDQVKWRPEQLNRLWSDIWPEAVRDFGRCGIYLQNDFGEGSVWRPPGREPVLTGLESGAINFVITNRIPLEWDGGRGLSGVTMQYRGHHLCMIALNRAHGHQIPLLSVNTCVHEMLHVLLQDVFERRPPGFPGQAREFRIDWYATRLWLFHSGGEIRQSAQAYLDRRRLTPYGRWNTISSPNAFVSKAYFPTMFRSSGV